MSDFWTVPGLNRYLADRFKQDGNLRSILIKGEISNYKRYPSGHCYFTLKGEDSALKCVMWKTNADDLRFVPENGMGVIAEGSVAVYERDGVYQLYVTSITADGIGQLFAALNKTREKLEADGLFEQSRKKPLPVFPKKIAVVAGENSAALFDIEEITHRRNPLIITEVFPAVVQGAAAPDSIVEALKKADNSGADIIICGRGGGSFEDLYAFSTEKVARAFAETTTPIISAVGHETDTSLSDFTADLRAPTPSAAAELAVPDVYGILEALRVRLIPPESKLKEAQSRLEAIKTRFDKSLENILSAGENRLLRDIKSLEAVNPLSVLSRGYAVVKKDGAAIAEAKNLFSGDRVTLKFSDGEVNAQITD
ncbi:MAG: exodeoxyribonuclease VII large subunit [Ruminococcus sp.]|jgi:exodeoxyribonuclease VII large subunit|nr:exodeoxyribonuclease VII large subunit [Ruminococcus sp.]